MGWRNLVGNLPCPCLHNTHNWLHGGGCMLEKVVKKSWFEGLGEAELAVVS